MLIYRQEAEFTASGEMRQIAAAHLALMEEASRRGIFRAADRLTDAATATTVRVHGGKVSVTDGPFAETKEQLAGYYILDCENLDQALEWATKVPAAWRGSAVCVEVRPVREIRKPAGLNDERCDHRVDLPE
ncbi:MAG: YciI family protein [Acidobacteriota bacterium]|nr:YciI family protein [Acidobacteriota bacterium]